MRHQSRLSLVQIMACPLLGTNPLSQPQPMLVYYQLKYLEHIFSGIWVKYNNFHRRKCRLQNGNHFGLAPVYWYQHSCAILTLNARWYLAISCQPFETLWSDQGQRIPWWRHQMETFSALLAFCAENSPVTGEFPSQRPVTRSFHVFFDMRLNKRMSKQS